MVSFRRPPRRGRPPLTEVTSSLCSSPVHVATDTWDSNDETSTQRALLTPDPCDVYALDAPKSAWMIIQQCSCRKKATLGDFLEREQRLHEYI